MPLRVSCNGASVTILNSEGTFWDGTAMPGASVGGFYFSGDNHCCGILKIGQFSYVSPGSRLSKAAKDEYNREMYSCFMEGLDFALDVKKNGHRKGYCFASLAYHGSTAFDSDSLEERLTRADYPIVIRALLDSGFKMYHGFINPNSGNYVEVFGRTMKNVPQVKDFI